MTRPVTSPSLKFTGSIGAATETVMFSSDNQPGASYFNLSVYSSAAVSLHIYQRKPYSTWHTKKTYVVAAATPSADHAVVVKNLYGPVEISIENAGGSPATVEFEMIAESE